MKTFAILILPLLSLYNHCDGQKITFGQDKVDIVQKTSSGSSGLKDGTTIVNQKAASSYQNCNCQCDSVTWTDGNAIRGNCRSQDRNGALFCYVSGSALCSCRDVQVSSFLKGNDGRFKYYSYEACTTPPRNQCSNYGLGNFGDGDFPYCSFGSGFGSNRPSNSQPSRPNYGNNRPNYGNSRPNYGNSRPTFGNNRPTFGSNQPFRGSNGNNGSPTLDDILSGVRTGSTSNPSSSSDSGKKPSSRPISFADA